MALVEDEEASALVAVDENGANSVVVGQLELELAPPLLAIMLQAPSSLQVPEMPSRAHGIPVGSGAEGIHTPSRQ